MSNLTNKIAEIITCPNCLHGDLADSGTVVSCNACNSSYMLVGDVRVLIPESSPVMSWFKKSLTRETREARYPLLERTMKALAPEPDYGHEGPYLH